MRTNDRGASAPPSLTDKASDIAALLLPGAVLLLPLTSNTVAEGALSGLTVLVAAMLFVLLLASFAAVAIRRTASFSPAAAAGWVLPPFMALSFLMSPSGQGAILTVFALGALGVLLATAEVGPRRLPLLVAMPLLITASLQSLIVIAQTLTDRAIGLTLIDPGAELHLIDGLLRPQGTMHHVYEPAALSLLAAGVALVTTDSVPRRYLWLWATGAGLAGTTIGLTHSRAALLGLLLAVPFVLVAIQRRTRFVPIVGGALLIGFLLAAASTASAWALRGDQSVAGDLDDASLGRVTLIKQAVTMSADNPVLGVGPGRYLDTMRAEYELNKDYPFIVHNATLAVAAENGIAVAVVSCILVAWAVARAIRAGPLTAVLAVVPLGFLVFDVLHYDRPAGLLMMAIWLGVLHVYDNPDTAAQHSGSNVATG